ncbi:MAG: putative quinol monooxygenase [Chloroflexota bacterium]
MLLIIGRLQVWTEQGTAFLAYAREVIEQERKVEGCMGFKILQDINQADHFVMMEQWRDQAALDQHLKSEAYARNSTKMDNFFAAEAQWLEFEE